MIIKPLFAATLSQQSECFISLPTHEINVLLVINNKLIWLSLELRKLDITWLLYWLTFSCCHALPLCLCCYLNQINVHSDTYFHAGLMAKLLVLMHKLLLHWSHSLGMSFVFYLQFQISLQWYPPCFFFFWGDFFSFWSENTLINNKSYK